MLAEISGGDVALVFAQRHQPLAQIRLHGHEAPCAVFVFSALTWINPLSKSTSLQSSRSISARRSPANKPIAMYGRIRCWISSNALLVGSQNPRRAADDLCFRRFCRWIFDEYPPRIAKVNAGRTPLSIMVVGLWPDGERIAAIPRVLARDCRHDPSRRRSFLANRTARLA